MSASVTRKKQCVKCNKSGGILICDGCQQTFCGKHVIEHRQHIANQVDGIMQEHDLVQQELQQSSNNNSLLKIIDQWEKESIKKIQVTAEAARADLKQIRDSSKERISKTWRDVAENLRSSREADDYTENDLTRWMEQLEQLKLEIESFPTVKMAEDEASIIHLITIQSSQSINKDFEPHKKHSVVKRSPGLFLEERFSKVIGLATIDERGLLAKYNGNTSKYAFVLGQNLYFEGQQTVRFHIEQRTKPYNIFFGCISSKANQNEINYHSPFAVEWFGLNAVYQDASLEVGFNFHGYRSNEISTNDMLHRTFDCENRQLKLFHERSNQTDTLPVNIETAPFPWQLLLVLTSVNDCVRILI